MWALCLTSHACSWLQDSQKAVSAAQSALELSKKMQDGRLQVESLFALTNARVLRASAGAHPMLQMAENSDEKNEALRRKHKKELDLALHSGREAVTICLDLGETKGRAEAMRKVAAVYVALGDAEDARRAAREAQDVFQDQQDNHGEARVLRVLIAANLINEEDHVDALFAAKDALRLFRGRDRRSQEEDSWALASMLHLLAKVHLALKEPGQALQACEDSCRHYSDLGAPAHILGAVLHTQSTIRLVKKEPDAAVQAQQRALDLFQKAKDRRGEAFSLYHMAHVLLDGVFADLSAKAQVYSDEQQKKADVGWKFADQALVLYTKIQLKAGEAMVSKLIEEMTEKAKEVQKRMAVPTRTVYMFDPDTKKTLCKEFYDEERSLATPVG